MSESVRPEHAERVRDFYRNQGAAKERERIYGLVRSYADEDYPKNLDETLKISLAAIANGALASGHNYGAIDERNRIIDLLGKLKSAPECFELDVDALIAVIKGESK